MKAIPLFISPSLNIYRGKIEEDLRLAQKRIEHFAKKFGYENFIIDSFLDQVEIYDSQKQFIKRAIEVAEVDPNIELPKTISACLENRILMAVSEDIYKTLNTDQKNDELAYQKLFTHEIAHRLHIRILNNDAEAMGPMWFFEGFALFVANQYEDFELSENEIFDIIKTNKQTSYKYYSAIFRYLVKHIDLNSLLIKAKDHDFVEFLYDHICK